MTLQRFSTEFVLFTAMLLGNSAFITGRVPCLFITQLTLHLYTTSSDSVYIPLIDVPRD